jgi:TPR repeat protein
MPISVEQAAQDWRDADARAREATAALVAAQLAYSERLGPEPEPSLITEAKLLRKIADQNLSKLIASIKR